eukprot:TRINITY_DN79554_c0_g1_i1.p1 TRINITY_DN79554_c0_g1~~TRINITY_DN79554_c0_g1_i1.p1  ORF type:complete len:311 (+),score=58.20 TRINITY_DN79554_c0_g1_i1:68-1000(+)
MAHPTLLTACSNPSWAQNFWSRDMQKSAASRDVDTQDDQWRADAEYAPDKESMWDYPKEKDRWALVNNAIRGEVSALKDALTKLVEHGNFQTWEVDSFCVAWSEHLTHMHAHHSSQESVMYPFLATRIRVPERLRSCRDELRRQLNRIAGLVSVLSAGLDEHPRRSGYVRSILDAMHEYEQTILPHLSEEELGPLPLMRAYFKPDEVAPIVQNIVGVGPSCQMGSFIHFAGDEGFFAFMKQEGMPGYAWYLDLRGKRDHFRRHFVQNLEAVTGGTPPRTLSFLSGWCWQAQVKTDEITVPVSQGMLDKQA